MRFMLMVIHPENVAQSMPAEEAMAAMLKYNEEMVKAGVLLSAEGLLPTSQGARVHYVNGHKPRVQEGPFAEGKEVVGGFWIVQVSSKEEALEWARRIPFAHEAIVEVRRVGEPDDYGSPEIAEKEKALGKQIEAQQKHKT